MIKLMIQLCGFPLIFVGAFWISTTTPNAWGGMLLLAIGAFVSGAIIFGHREKLSER